MVLIGKSRTIPHRPLLFENNGPAHAAMALSTALIDICARGRSNRDPYGLPRPENNAGAGCSGRSGYNPALTISKQPTVEFVGFPPCVINGEYDRFRSFRPNEVRRKTKILRD